MLFEYLDTTATSRGLIGVGIALCSEAEQAPLDRIPMDSRLYADRSNMTGRGTQCCLLVVSAYAPTDYSPDKVKYKFFKKRYNLLKDNRLNVVIMTDDFNVQLDKLNRIERHLGGSHGVLA